LELKQEPDLRRVLSQETKLEALCNDTNIFFGNRLDEKQLLETSLKKSEDWRVPSLCIAIQVER
jgi:hypothetical protein